MITKIRTLSRLGDDVGIGIGLALVTGVVSGASVFVNASAVRSVGDPVLFTTLKNGVAAVLLASLALAFVPRLPSRVRAFEPRALGGLVLLGVIGGSIPFVLFFTGLAHASAPAAAVIHKTLFAWVALLAVVMLRERLGWLQLGALGVLLVSQLLVQPPEGLAWSSGESLIAMATAMWAIEVVIAKRLLATVPSPIAAASRMGVGLVILVAYGAATGALKGMGSLGIEQWAWVAGTGILLTAYVATWYAALRRAPATAVTAVLTVGAPITALLQLVASGQVPAPGAVTGYAGTLAACLLVAWVALRRSPGRRPAAFTA